MKWVYFVAIRKEVRRCAAVWSKIACRFAKERHKYLWIISEALGGEKRVRALSREAV